MPTYVIGDVHGCFRTFQKLLERIRFNPNEDRIYFVGDLVNGGSESLSMLRWAHHHRDIVEVTLGNHDIYLLARAFDVCRRKSRDTLDAVLEATDRWDLIDWLRRRPLLFRRGHLALVHAGLMPDWSLETAAELALSIESKLQSDSAADFLGELFEKKREAWDPRAKPRLRRLVALQVLTTLRTCRTNGTICRRFAGPPEEAPDGCVPWYESRSRFSDDPLFIFGHWAALGFRRLPGAIALDSGCVWGGSLTAVRLDDFEVFQLANSER